MKDDEPRNRKRRPSHYVEIFISGSRNIEFLIFTKKTKYFCSAVVLGGFEI